MFSDPIIILFSGTDLEMREIGSLCIRLQCLTLPLHAWVTVVNMLCTALGNAGGALLLSTSRQGTCFIPIVHIMASLFGAMGVASIQAVADVLSLVLAIPLAIFMSRKLKQAQAEAISMAKEVSPGC